MKPIKINLMKKLFLSFVVVMLCISVIAQNSVNLKLNLEKNKVYRFNSASESAVTQTINGSSQSSDTKINNTVSIKMIDATPDFMITEFRFDSLITISNAMGKVTNMNSSKDGDMKSSEATDVMRCINNRLSKNALYVKMDFSGKVLQVVNSKILSDIILKDTSSITLKDPIKSMIKKQMENMISEKALKTMIEEYTYFLPAKEVSVGNNWNVTVNTSTGGMSLDVITNYHLDGINGNNANITAESEVKPPANAEPIKSGPTTVTYDDLRGQSKSTMVIDIRTGFMIEAKTKSHTAGNLGISYPGGSMQMPMDINSESKVTAIN
jgi:hypothetical protein